MPVPIPPNAQTLWTAQILQARVDAIYAIENANFLVRRVSAEERAQLEVQVDLPDLTDQHLDALFPPGVEPIKVFSLDTRFRFQDNQRNYNQNDYCTTMMIPITPRLTGYFRLYFHPDAIQGGVPTEFRGNPAFKVEHGTTTIVIRKVGWKAFWNLVDDVEFTSGFLSYGDSQTIGF